MFDEDAKKYHWPNSNIILKKKTSNHNVTFYALRLACLVNFGEKKSKVIPMIILSVFNHFHENSCPYISNMGSETTYKPLIYEEQGCFCVSSQHYIKTDSQKIFQFK